MKAIKRLKATAAAKPPKQPNALFKKGDTAILRSSVYGNKPVIIVKDLFFNTKENAWGYGYRRADTPDKKTYFAAHNWLTPQTNAKVSGLAPQTEAALRKMLESRIKSGAPSKKLIAQLRKLADKFEKMGDGVSKKVDELMPGATKALMKYATGGALVAEDVKGDKLHITDQDTLEELVMENGGKTADLLDEYMAYGEDPLQLLHDELRDFT